MRQAFALALYDGFLNHLSLPLGPTDIFSAGCRPSQTTHQSMFSHGELAIQYKESGITLSPRPTLTSWTSNSSHLYYTLSIIPQRQAVVKFYGVFASHWRSLAFTPVQYVRRTLAWDNGTLVTPFMQADIQSAGYCAHICYFILSNY